jgi:hypothetical protein
MRNTKIIVQHYSGILIPLARSSPVEVKIIVQDINGTIEPVTTLKNIATDILSLTANTLPVAPPVSYYSTP